MRSLCACYSLRFSPSPYEENQQQDRSVNYFLENFDINSTSLLKVFSGSSPGIREAMAMATAKSPTMIFSTAPQLAAIQVIKLLIRIFPHTRSSYHNKQKYLVILFAHEESVLLLEKVHTSFRNEADLGNSANRPPR